MSESELPPSGERITAPPSSTGSVSQLKVEPLHHPEEMAQVKAPHNLENIPHGKTLMTTKALLAKKVADTGTAFYSPSDAMVSPCTQKLTSQKGKRWANAKVKPVLFGKSNLKTSATPFQAPNDIKPESNGTSLVSAALQDVDVNAGPGYTQSDQPEGIPADQVAPSNVVDAS